MNVRGHSSLWHYLVLAMDGNKLCICLPCSSICNSGIQSFCTWEHSIHLPIAWSAHSSLARPCRLQMDHSGWLAWPYFLFLLLQGVDIHVLLQQPLLYSHFASGGGEPCYLPVKDWEGLKALLTETLDHYNELNAAMHLVLFEDAMHHVWVDSSRCFLYKVKAPTVTVFQ